MVGPGHCIFYSCACINTPDSTQLQVCVLLLSTHASIINWLLQWYLVYCHLKYNSWFYYLPWALATYKFCSRVPGNWAVADHFCPGVQRISYVPWTNRKNTNFILLSIFYCIVWLGGNDDSLMCCVTSP